MSPRPDQVTTPTSPPPACSRWERLLTVSSFDTLMPDERAKLLEHLDSCAYCRQVRFEYETIDALMHLIAREAPAEVARLLSEEAAEGVRSHFVPAIPEPPDGLPPALLALWEEEDQQAAVQQTAPATEQSSSAPPLARETTPPPLALPPASPPKLVAANAPRARARRLSEPVRRLFSLLHTPDHPDEAVHFSYSPEIAGRLVTSYQYLKLNRFFDAYATLYPLQGHAMSRLQRLRMWYALAHASAGTEAYGRALAFLDEALGQASLLGDVAACAELAYLRGSINGALQNFGDAVGDLLQASRALRSLTSTAESADPDLEVSVLLPLASFSFLIARFEDVQEYLVLARRLLPLVDQSSLHSATIEWLTSLLYRWSGQPPEALRAAMAAAEAYLRPELRAVPLLQARILAVTADCALDIAESLPGGPGSDRDAILSLARRYAVRGVKLALDARGGQTGETEAVHALTLLTKARFERMAHRPSDRVALYNRVIHTAETLGDTPLLTQALTALGDEWAEQGEASKSLTFYRQALNLQAGGDAPALSAVARRKLLLAAEMSDR